MIDAVAGSGGAHLAPTQPSSSRFKVAAAHCDITPTQPLPLAGFGTRTGVWSSIHSRLEANAVMLDDGAQRVFLVSADLLYIGAALRNRILDLLGGRIGEEELLLAASHSHYAPATSELLPQLGSVNHDYREYIARQIATLVDQLLTSPATPATLRHARAQADHSVNRRRVPFSDHFRPAAARSAQMAPNFRAPRDETVHVLRFDDAHDRPLALVWNYACHPVFFPNRDQVSAEFPGVVRNSLRDDYGRGLPVVYLQGFAGNVRPRAILPAHGVRGWLRNLTNRHYWKHFTLEEWTTWATSLAAVTTAAAENARRAAPIAVALQRSRHSETCAWMLAAGAVAGGRPFSIQHVRFAEAVHLIAVSAEPMVEYIDVLRQIFPNGAIIAVGCIDEVVGYLPTRAMLSEGGYEVEDFRRAFDIDARFETAVEARFVERLKSFAQPAPTN